MIVKHLSSKGYVSSGPWSTGTCLTAQVFVIFDDCRQATKLVAELRRRPVKLNDAFPPVELQCVVVERATVESVCPFHNVSSVLILLRKWIRGPTKLANRYFPKPLSHSKWSDRPPLRIMWS